MIGIANNAEGARSISTVLLLSSFGFTYVLHIGKRIGTFFWRHPVEKSHGKCANENPPKANTAA